MPSQRLTVVFSLLLATVLPTAAMAADKDVNVINTPLEVDGNVNATVTNTVDANITNTVDVSVSQSTTVPVDIQNMVDVQSLPAVQIAPSQQVGTVPGVIDPNSLFALGLTCTAPANQNGIRCEYDNPNVDIDGWRVTHISLRPLVSILGTAGTVCAANASVGPALIAHSWAADQPLGTHIVLPYAVPITVPNRNPAAFVSKTGDTTKGCGVDVTFHGYRP